jgi:large-conductance mechanosensitive channel
LDDTPKAFIQELRSSLLRRTVGQIAIAVLLAQAALRLVNALIWYFVIPLLGRALRGDTESVLFSSATTRPIPWENLFGSLLEFTATVVLVFYLNRWVQRKPVPVSEEPIRKEDVSIEEVPESAAGAKPEYNLVGELITGDPDKQQK